MFDILFWRQWLVVMSVTRSIVKMSVLPPVVSLSSPRSLPRDHDLAATRRSTPLRSLHLVVVLPMRRSASRCILQRFIPHGRLWTTARRIPWMWCISAIKLATTWSRRGALMRDSGLSFIKIGIGLSFIRSHCHTPFWERGNETSIRVPRMFKSHAWQQLINRWNVINKRVILLT
jgi:hypothetical protein